jgi:hypothetical protein
MLTCVFTAPGVLYLRMGSEIFATVGMLIGCKESRSRDRFKV